MGLERTFDESFDEALSTNKDTLLHKIRDDEENITPLELTSVLAQLGENKDEKGLEEVYEEIHAWMQQGGIPGSEEKALAFIDNYCAVADSYTRARKRQRDTPASSAHGLIGPTQGLYRKATGYWPERN